MNSPEKITPITPRWEHFPHDADVGVRGIGTSKAEAFEQAALGLLAVVTDPRMVRGKIPVEFECAAPDDELLLVEWLNSLIYEMATRRMLFAEFTIRIEAGKLIGTAWGEAVDPDRQDLAVEVKGATCTELKVARHANGEWRAQCVIDV